MPALLALMEPSWRLIRGTGLNLPILSLHMFALRTFSVNDDIRA